MIDREKIYVWFRGDGNEFLFLKKVTFGIACMLSGLNNIQEIMVGPSNASGLVHTRGNKDLGIMNIIFNKNEVKDIATYKMIPDKIWDNVKVNFYKIRQENVPINPEDAIKIISFREFAMRYPGR